MPNHYDMIVIPVSRVFHTEILYRVHPTFWVFFPLWVDSTRLVGDNTCRQANIKQGILTYALFSEALQYYLSTHIIPIALSHESLLELLSDTPFYYSWSFSLIHHSIARLNVIGMCCLCAFQISLYHVCEQRQSLGKCIAS